MAQREAAAGDEPSAPSCDPAEAEPSSAAKLQIKPVTRYPAPTGLFGVWRGLAVSGVPAGSAADQSVVAV
jgi:hypothetical protein